MSRPDQALPRATGGAPAARPGSSPQGGRPSGSGGSKHAADENTAAAAERRSSSHDRRSLGSDRASSSSDAGALKDAFLARIRQEKKFLYGTVVAQAHRIGVQGDEITFAFAPPHKALRAQLEQHRVWLEGIAEAVAGRRMAIVTQEAAPAPAAEPVEDSSAPDTGSAELRARVMQNEGVQALLDVFHAEIKDIEEM